MEQGKPFSATESPLVDFDAVCQKVRAAVEPARAHAVSLHDEHGDLLWLTESSMGPDEHNAVREAIEAFSSSDAPSVLAYDLGDFRSALLLRAANASRAMVGAVMLVVDTRVIKKDARGNINVMTPKLQRALTDFAGMRPDTGPAVEAAPASAPVPPAKAGLASVKTLGKSDSPARKAACHRGARAAQAVGRPAPRAHPAEPAARGSQNLRPRAARTRTVRSPAPRRRARRPAPRCAAWRVPRPLRARTRAPHRARACQWVVARALAGRFGARAGREAALARRRRRSHRPLRSRCRRRARPARGHTGDRPAACGTTPQSDRAARAAPRAARQGQPAEALRSAAALQIRRSARCRASGDAQGGGGQWPGLDDRPARRDRAHRLAGPSPRRVAAPMP